MAKVAFLVEFSLLRPCDTSHYPKEVPFEVPKGWCWTTIGDVFLHNTGKALNAADKDGKMLSYITTSNLYWDKFELTTLKTMLFTEEELEKCTARKGDLLVCEGGDIGRSAIWEQEYEIRIQNHIHKLRGLGGVNHRLFMFWLMYMKVKGMIGGKGIGLLGLSSRDLDKMLIPLPPLYEQNRIVKSIDGHFSVVGELERAEATLSETIYSTKTRILDLAIHGKLVPQDPSDEPAIDLLKRINPNFQSSDNLHYEDIPQSWTVCRLSDVCVDFIVPQRNKPKIFDGDIPWCRIEDIEGKYLKGSLSGRLVSRNTIREMNMRICPVGTVICSCSASIGTQAIVTRPCCTNQTFIGLVSDERFIYNEFLYYFLASQTEQFLDIGTGTTIKYISREKFEEYRMPLPPLSEQRRIVERIEYYLLLLKQIESAINAC